MRTSRRPFGEARGNARLVDVARRAGVSTASVSRAMNSPQKVSPDLRARIQDALNKLRYVPNGAARALASRRSYTIGAVVPTLSNSIFGSGVAALQQRLEEYGYTLLVANSRYDIAVETRQIRALVERGVDGLVLVGQKHRPDTYELVRKFRVPYVNTYLASKGSVHPCVGFDQRAAAARLAEHLIELGHRRIGLITYPFTNNDRVSARMRGMRDTIQRHGLPFSADLVAEAPYSLPDGRAALRRLLQADPGLTAVMCTTDLHATGALVEAHAQGLAVPGRLSVTGFDDLDSSLHQIPPLTTVHIPAQAMGTRAAEYLVARLRGQAVPRVMMLEAKVVIRGSTGPAPP
ncbi:MAG: LacI family DNA-binding transcriptional regulator [Alphaproteobacteria bacterium]|nr:LacI family DNA-binding transcriptional regulator [Alphaproteobacteria bacterium]